VKIDSKRLTSLLEHYAYATLAAGLAIWQSGNHNIKEVAWAALIGVVGPVIAHVNPKSLVNNVIADTKVDPITASVIEAVTTAAVEEAQKVVESATPTTEAPTTK
jgi:hypothetical protein